MGEESICLSFAKNIPLPACWPAKVADTKKNRLAITGKRNKNHNDLANYLVAEEGSSLDDIYDLAISTDGKIFFACRPDLPDDGKDVRNAIQTVVDTWLIFDKDGGA